MLDFVEYASLFQYSPRGKSAISIKSREVTGTIKAGRYSDRFRQGTSKFINENYELFSSFLNPDATLVPAPRSSKIQEGSLWPALEIVNMLAAFNLGTPASCLIRRNAVKKSSLCYSADERPSIADQFDSMYVEDYVPSANITLVDDVLTLGRTSIAGASRLAEKFPNATIRVFTLMRTMGFVEIDNIRAPINGTISYNSFSGKCTREP